MKKTITLFFAAMITLQNLHAQNWKLIGNGGVVDTNYIGTKNAMSLKFRVNNNPSGKIDYLSTKAETSLGFQALKVNAAAGNTAFGYVSMAANTFGFANTAMGQYSMNLNVDGFSNTAVGSQSLGSNVSGYFNTAVGQAALAGSTSYDNTAVGRYALVSTTTGNSNSAFGSAANVNDGTYSNVTLLGFYTTGTASNQVRVGNSAVTSIGGQVGWSTLSDARVKTNVKQNVPGLDFINKLQPITYNLNLTAVDNIVKAPALKDASGKTILPSAADIAARQAKEKIVYSGFLAQDVEKIAKSLDYDFSGVDAAKNSKDLYGLRYSEFVVPLVKAVQELSKQNDAKDAKIDGLQKQIDDLKASITTGSQSTSAVSNVQTVQLNNSAVLEQNVPNPFANATTINYTLPQRYNKAVMIIADKAGKTVKEISLSGNGKGSVKIDAASLSNGTYHYSLYIDGRMTDSKQMLLGK